MRKINFAGLKRRLRPGRTAGPAAAGILVLLTGATGVLAARQAAQPVQVMETEVLMSEMFQPLYGELTRAIAKEPANRQAWRNVLSPATKLAELHNLLYSRRDKEYTQKPEWPQQAAASQKLMIAVAEAVRKQDYANTRKRYEAAVEGCNACHNKADPDAPLLKAYDPEVQK